MVDWEERALLCDGHHIKVSMAPPAHVSERPQQRYEQRSQQRRQRSQLQGAWRSNDRLRSIDEIGRTGWKKHACTLGFERAIRSGW